MEHNYKRNIKVSWSRLQNQLITIILLLTVGVPQSIRIYVRSFLNISIFCHQIQILISIRLHLFPMNFLVCKHILGSLDHLKNELPVFSVQNLFHLFFHGPKVGIWKHEQSKSSKFDNSGQTDKAICRVLQIYKYKCAHKIVPIHTIEKTRQTLYFRSQVLKFWFLAKKQFLSS